MISELTTFVPPFLHELLGAEQTLAELYRTANALGGVQCRIARGRKMLVRQSLFDETAAALQFPWYFSDNWDSFEECLGDLDWLSSKHIVLGISSAVDLLKEESDESLQVFSDIVQRAVTAHSQRVQRSVHVVFQFTRPEEAERLTRWWPKLHRL